MRYALRGVAFTVLAVASCTALTSLEELSEGTSTTTGASTTTSAGGGGSGGAGGGSGGGGAGTGAAGGGTSTSTGTSTTTGTGGAGGGTGGAGGAGGGTGGAGGAGGGGTLTMIFGDVPDADVTGVTTDTMTEADFPGYNYGTAVSLKSEGLPLSSILLRFAVDALPASAQIVSAELHVWTTGNPLASPVDVYEVLEEWEEGVQDAAPGISNHTIRVSPDVPWTSPGVGPGSRGLVVLAEFTPAVAYTEYPLSLPPALVAGWRDSPATNHGVVFVIKTSSAGVELASHEHAGVALRPWLAVTYQP